MSKPSSPLEKVIEKKIGDYAKSKGCLYRKLVSPANRAVPDRLIITPSGVVGFLEIKRLGQRPTPLQTRELRHLQEMQCNVGWCDEVNGGEYFINALLKHDPATPAISYRLADL